MPRQCGGSRTSERSVQKIDGDFMLIKTKDGIDSVRLRKGKHWAKCSKCGDAGLRGTTAKLCRWKWPICVGFVHHMPDTCIILGGACSPAETPKNPTKAG